MEEPLNDKHKRLEYLIRKVLRVKQKEIADILNVSAGQLSAAMKSPAEGYRKTWFSPEKIKALAEYPFIMEGGEVFVNPNWLEDGVGPIIVSRENQQQIAHSMSDHFHSLPVQPSTKPELKTIGEKAYGYGNPNLQVLVIAVDPQNEEQVVVVPEYALAGYTDGYRDPEFIRELPTEPCPHDLAGRGTIRKFQVYGDSMEPAVMHRDFVYCSFVEIRSPLELTQKIRNGYLYVVNSTRGPMLKKLYYRDGDQFIQCVSRNKAYPPFNLHLSEIRELWYWRRKYTGQIDNDDQDILLEGIQTINNNIIELGSGLQSGFKEIKKEFKKTITD